MKSFIFILTVFLLSQDEIAVMVSHFNRGNYHKCIELGEKVLVEDKKNKDALKYIVLSYIRLNKCESAAPYLEMWKNFFPEDPLPFYYSGLCDFKNFRYSSAVENFSHSATGVYPYNEYSLLMKATAYVKMDKYKEALRVLSDLRYAKNDEVRIKASELESEIRGKRFYYTLLLETSLLYDSNAGLIPDDEPLRSLFTDYYGRGEDLVGNFYLNGELYGRASKGLYVGGDYKFFQNLHSGLHGLNFHVHRIECKVFTRKLRGLNGGGGVFYSRGFISTSLDSFSEGIGGNGFISFKVKGIEISGYGRIYHEDFFENFTGKQDRDGWFFEAELSLSRSFSRLSLKGGALFRFNEADGDDWDSSSVSVKGNLVYLVIEKFSFISSVIYTYRGFLNVDSIFNERREDHAIEWDAGFIYRPFKYLEVLLSYILVKEFSKIDMYSYTRHIIGAGLRYSVR